MCGIPDKEVKSRLKPAETVPFGFVFQGKQTSLSPGLDNEVEGVERLRAPSCYGH